MAQQTIVFSFGNDGRLAKSGFKFRIYDCIDYMPIIFYIHVYNTLHKNNISSPF